MKLAFTVSFLTMLVAPLLNAQVSTQSELQQPAFRLDVHMVVVDTQVVEKKSNHAVTTLKQEDFQVYEDKVQQSITAFSQDTLPLSVLLLFDLTDSVRPVLQPLADGALEALRHLKPEDQVAVMVYSATADLIQDFTTDRALAVAAIERAAKMKSDQAALFNEGMFQAARQLGQVQDTSSRRVIIWLTDDVPNIPSTSLPTSVRRKMPDELLHTEKEALKELLRNGAVVNSLLLRSEISDREGPGLMSHIGERMLFPPGEVYRYARATGGEVLESRKKLPERLATLIDDVRRRYSLGYHPAQEKPKGKFCAIKVKLTEQARKATGDVKIAARQGYYR